MQPFQIKRIRLTMGMTQQEFMKVTGLTQSAMSKIENGLLNSDKYDAAINTAFTNWKLSRVEQLKAEIAHIESL